jgi:mono/diheme cytochrome c family protein
VAQTYNGFPDTNIRSGGKFHGIIPEGVVAFSSSRGWWVPPITTRAGAEAPARFRKWRFDMLDTAARQLFIVFTLALALALAAASAPHAQGPQQPPSVSLSASLVGRDSFQQYCAWCHGSGGRGDGAGAAGLKTRPADLTTLARRNGGAYPGGRVRETVIGGTGVPAAHSPEMPTWGPIFRTFEGDTRTRVRIDNLVAFIETLQVPSTAVGDQGSQLFRTYCASCHGTDARGTGPLTDRMRHQPPDLTRFAARNGGVFPSERVRRIIDGRDVASHGDRDMPVWGDAFKRTRDGRSEAEVKLRIEAIVKYLEAIQERATH